MKETDISTAFQPNYHVIYPQLYSLSLFSPHFIINGSFQQKSTEMETHKSLFTTKRKEISFEVLHKQRVKCGSKDIMIITLGEDFLASMTTKLYLISYSNVILSLISDS